MTTHRRRLPRSDPIAAGAFAVVVVGGYLQASTLARSIALWDLGLERQRLDDALPAVVGTGALLAAAAVTLVLDRKPRAAISVAPAAVVPPALVAVQAGAGATFLTSLAVVSFAAGGALGAVFSRRRPRRHPASSRRKSEGSP
jgi:hypothetical protein